MDTALEQPTGTDNGVRAGREAAARFSWSEASAMLAAADAVNSLDADDLDLLAESTWWLGRTRDCIAARERAYAAYLARGDRRRAALMATHLGEHHGVLLEMSVARAWLTRAEKLLDDDPDCVERGHLALVLRLFGADSALAIEAIEIATQHGDRDLLGLALSVQGGILVRGGEVDEGMALLDEATVAAVGGELGPHATGWILCMMISACAGLADWQRAGHWAEATKRWCDRQAINGYPGVCRVHRAEIMRLRGPLADAEEEARAATVELAGFNLMIAGWAFHELGEVRLRMGNFDAAEEAFRQAHELGRSPQPGLALVQLRRGKIEASVKAIGRELRDEAHGPLDRAKLLPSQVEIALAAGDVDTARAAADELAEIAVSFATPAMQAEADAARARVALSVGELTAAEETAKRARRLWMQADISYEAARMGMVIGEIYTRAGDPEAALLELSAAKSTFERVGAAPDAAAASTRIGTLSVAPAGRRVARTFLFSDIVKSTNLLEAIGDEAWMDLLGWHDATMREQFLAHRGEEVDHAGDGFFVAFDTADAALACATAIQRLLLEQRRVHGFAPSVRIGVHATDASEASGTYRGKGVHVAARIGTLAEGGEILVSASTAECLATPASLSATRPVALKGVTEQMEVASVEWHDRSI